MKTGMNLLLWTTEVTAEHDGLLDQLKGMGFDALEIPVFNLDDLAPYERLGKRLKSLGLGATAVTIMTPEANPVSPDAAIRKAAVARLARVLECCAAFGCEILCGPIHSAIGQTKEATAVAKVVVVKALAAMTSAATALPALNPYQPTHSMPVPTIHRTRL